MTAELADKKAAKYDAQMDAEARQWLQDVVGEPFPGGLGNVSQDSLVAALGDGIYLCKAINVIAPGSVKKINESKMAFKKMENIGNFLEGCYAYGLSKTDVFQTVDLYEGQNIPQVVNGIHALGRKAHKKNPSQVPALGPKEADKQERHFTEEQLKAGQGVIGLQMGSNRGASQAGMSPYGLGRQIEKTNLKQ